MTQTGNENDFDKQLQETARKKTLGAFFSVADGKLQELHKAAVPELEKYRKAREGLVDRFQKLDGKLGELEQQLSTCHPQWEELLRKAVCGRVYQPLEELRQEVMEKQSTPENRVQEATRDFELATARLDAWKTISKSVDAQVAKNEAWHKEICSLDSCEDSRFGLYIYYFELLPAQRLLQPPPEEGYDVKYDDPVKAFCFSAHGPCGRRSQRGQGADEESELDLPERPWLVDPDTYMEQLLAAWRRWRALGEAKVLAEADLEQVKKTRERYLQESKPELLRDKARVALRAQELSRRASGGALQQPPSSSTTV